MLIFSFNSLNSATTWWQWRDQKWSPSLQWWWTRLTSASAPQSSPGWNTAQPCSMPTPSPRSLHLSSPSPAIASECCIARHQNACCISRMGEWPTNNAQRLAHGKTDLPWRCTPLVRWASIPPPWPTSCLGRERRADRRSTLSSLSWGLKVKTCWIHLPQTFWFWMF